MLIKVVDKLFSEYDRSKSRKFKILFLLNLSNLNLQLDNK